ncbi:MAG: hypothetical protein EXR77_02200 [Myxococcales bacterium]|nr:hypothetical protein [Myxococcales bacterium]
MHTAQLSARHDAGLVCSGAQGERGHGPALASSSAAVDTNEAVLGSSNAAVSANSAWACARGAAQRCTAAWAQGVPPSSLAHPIAMVSSQPQYPMPQAHPPQLVVAAQRQCDRFGVRLEARRAATAQRSESFHLGWRFPASRRVQAPMTAAFGQGQHRGTGLVARASAAQPSRSPPLAPPNLR